MKVEYAYLTQQFAQGDALTKDIFRDIQEELRRGYFTLGPWTEKFELAVCEKYGVKHCVGVNSGTDALILSMKALGVGYGDTVLTQPNTFVATVGAICAVGARPMFVDVDETYQMDLEQGLHRKVKCAIPVHLTGLARDTNGAWPLVINDAAQAIGASQKKDSIYYPQTLTNLHRGSGPPLDHSVANFQHVSCFSLHPLKNIHVWGDGGFITTNDGALAKDLRLLRNHGLLDRDTVVVPGINSRLDSLQAIVGWHMLKKVDEINEQRRANAARYDAGLREIPRVVVPPRDPAYYQVFHTYVVTVEDWRDELIRHLASQGVEAKIHYPKCIHEQPGFKYLGYRRGDFPVAEWQADHQISLPIHEYLSEDQIDFVIDQIADFYRHR